MENINLSEAILFIIIGFGGFMAFIYLMANLDKINLPKFKAMENININSTNSRSIFWRVIAVLLIIVLYLVALGNRYVVNNNGIYDKWKQKAMYHIPHSPFKWSDWNENPRL